MNNDTSKPSKGLS